MDKVAVLAAATAGHHAGSSGCIWRGWAAPYTVASQTEAAQKSPCSLCVTIQARAPAARFPTPETTPVQVVEAMLGAMRADEPDLRGAFGLFSRARRNFFEDAARRDMREQRPSEARVHAAMTEVLDRDCPGLLGHRTAEVVGSLGDPAPEQGMLPKWLCYVAVTGGGARMRSKFVFSLTRQSDFDGGDPRDRDGFERCWLVWEVRPSESGGSAVVEAPEPVPT